MALTPEDVLNKTFTQTQFRKGYDEREVDDFLDEIVAEMRRSSQAAEDLRAQLSDCRAGRGLPDVDTTEAADQLAALRSEHEDLQGRFTAVNGDLETLTAENSSLKSRIGELENEIAQTVEAAEARAGELAERVAEAERRAEEADQRVAAAAASAEDAAEAAQGAADSRAAAAAQRAEEAEREAQERIQRALAEAERAEQEAQERANAAAAQPAPLAGSIDDTGTMQAIGGSDSAAGIIALAQRVHDEHVAEGDARRQSLFAEGQARFDELLSSGQAQHDELVSTGQARHDELVSTGQAQHDELVSTGQARHDELISTGEARNEELITTGQERHDSLISEATSRHEELITEARERSTGMIHEAQQRKQQILEELAAERTHLERAIDTLRDFERGYRGRMKDFITSQLGELDNLGAAAEGRGEAQGEADQGEQSED